MCARIVVIGASLGGLDALSSLLGTLPKDFPLPIAVVQHRSRFDNTNMLTSLLQEQTPLSVKEAEDKDPLLTGVYIAPADYHLVIDRGFCSLSLEPPVNHTRPSIDVLFESAADSYGPDAVGIILTGSNSDGARGAARIKDCGGTVIVQDPTECESDIMPLATMAALKVDFILKCRAIGALLTHQCLSAES